MERVVGEDRASGTSIVVALVLATLATMVVGELVPKSLAIARPRATAYALATPMVVITRVLGPLIRFLNGAANWTVRRLGIEPQEELTSVRSLEELELLIRASGRGGHARAGGAHPPHPVHPVRGEGCRERAGAAPLRAVDLRRRRGVDPRRASRDHRSLAVPGGGRRPGRRPRRRPRQGRLRRPVRGAGRLLDLVDHGAGVRGAGDPRPRRPARGPSSRREPPRGRGRRARRHGRDHHARGHPRGDRRRDR